VRLLELGCGEGPCARLVGRRDLCWIGLEARVECLGALRSNLSGGAIVDIERLDRLPHGFDAVLAADTFEHLNDYHAALARVHEALREGGRLFVSIPNVAHLYVRLAILFGRFPYADRGILDRTHRRFFTRASLRDELRQAGFAIVRETVSTVPLPLAFPRLPRWLLEALGAGLELVTRLLPTLLGYQLLVEARRL